MSRECQNPGNLAAPTAKAENMETQEPTFRHTVVPESLHLPLQRNREVIRSPERGRV